jgi:hypothetical protein
VCRAQWHRYKHNCRLSTYKRARALSWALRLILGPIFGTNKAKVRVREATTTAPTCKPRKKRLELESETDRELVGSGGGDG